MIAPDSPSISSNFHSISAFPDPNDIQPSTPIHRTSAIQTLPIHTNTTNTSKPIHNIARTWSLGLRKQQHSSPSNRSRSRSQPNPDDDSTYADQQPHTAPISDEQCEPEYNNQSNVTPQLSARARAALGPNSIFQKSSQPISSSHKSQSIKRWRSQVAPMHSPARQRRWFIGRASHAKDIASDKLDPTDVPVSTPFNDDYNNLDVDYLHSQRYRFTRHFTESQLEERWYDYFEQNHADNIRRILLYGLPLWFCAGILFDVTRDYNTNYSRYLQRTALHIAGLAIAIFFVLLMYHPQHHSHSRWRKFLDQISLCQFLRISSAASSALTALIVGVTETVVYSLEGDATTPVLLAVLLLLISLSPTAFRHSTIMCAAVNCLVIMCYFIIVCSFNAYPSIAELLYSALALLCMTAVFVDRASQMEARGRSEFLSFCHVQQEEQVSQKLLLKMMPLSIIGKLRAGAEYVYEKHEKVSVLFSHIHDFDLHTASMQPIQLVKTLNRIFSLFDELTDRHQVYKVETIGDVFLVCSGCPQEYARPDHASALAILAVDMMSVIGKFSVRHDEVRRSSIFKLDQLPTERSAGANESVIALRIGINTGAVIAGVIGKKHPRYRLMGDTINTASRMSTTCGASEIQISSTTHDELDCAVFECEARTVEVKGKGQMFTFILKGHNLEHSHSASRLTHIHTSPQMEMSRRTKFSQATAHQMNSSLPGLLTDDSGSPSSRGQAFRFDVEASGSDELAKTIREKSAQVTHLIPSNRRDSESGTQSVSGHSETDHNGTTCVSAAPSNAASRRPSESGPTSLDQILEAGEAVVRQGTWQLSATFQLPSEIDQANRERGIGRMYRSRSKSHSTNQTAFSTSNQSPVREVTVAQTTQNQRLQLSQNVIGRQVIAASHPKDSISMYTGTGTPSSFHHSSNDGANRSPSSSSPRHLKDHIIPLPLVSARIDSQSVVSSLETESHESHDTIEHPPSVQPVRSGHPKSHHSPAAAHSEPSFGSSLIPLRVTTTRLSPGSQQRFVNGRAPIKASSHHLQDSSADELENDIGSLQSRQLSTIDLKARRHPKADVVITAQSENVKKAKMFTYGDLLSLVDAPRPWRSKLCLSFLGHEDLEKRFQAEHRASMANSHWLHCCLISSTVCLAYEIAHLVNDTPNIGNIVAVTLLRLFVVVTNILYWRARANILSQQYFTFGLAFASAQCAVFIVVNRVLGTFDTPWGQCGVLVLLSIDITFTGMPLRHSILLVCISFVTWILSGIAFSQNLDLGIFVPVAGAFMYLVTTYVNEYHDRALFLRGLKHEGEKATTKQLLNNLLPKQVIDSLTSQPEAGKYIPFIAHERASADVLFCDVVQFTRMAAKSSPEDVVAILNVLFSTFDGLMDKFNVYKVETIGDAYLACSGVVEERVDHTKCLVACGLAMRRATRLFRTPHNEAIVVRVGIHTGFIIAGVVGQKMPRYHLFGETVSIAEEMEQRTPAGQVTISETTYNAMTEAELLHFDLRPLDAVKITGGIATSDTDLNSSTIDSSMCTRELGRFMVRSARSADADREREHASKKKRQHHRQTTLLTAMDDINNKLKGLKTARASSITEPSSQSTAISQQTTSERGNEQ